MGSDEIKITSPDGEKTITIPLSNPNANELIHSFINLNTPTETIARISKSGKLPKSKQKDTDNTTSIDTSSY